ncbi:Hypothetical protein LEPBI_I1220 [Leptospira biflexa serovar Patoc strain 'Patoc 1 (Paris)']|uniref:Uncharacterized protein n=1 Tax=Leptospira biflexa serovar Patoc (strain Patoc 1 / ATCC 23582 / Paris) TaxID=456481 RepID=B0SNQ3_LEPBP|nr:Hypothetical protein LEPBI_I1220 [Leptospira biflexa serovar Patoc strain 'Patoc 1 (Paris)']
MKKSSFFAWRRIHFQKRNDFRIYLSSDTDFASQSGLFMVNLQNQKFIAVALNFFFPPLGFYFL